MPDPISSQSERTGAEGREATASGRRDRAHNRPSLTQKSLRIGEKIIERAIFAIATLSIIFIFLIFFFIFREAAPIFLGKGAEATIAAVPENYDLAPGLDTAAGHAASYAKAPADTGDVIQYNPDAKDIPTRGAATASAGGDASKKADTGDVIQYNPDAKDIPTAASSTGTKESTDVDAKPELTEATAGTQAQKDSLARLIVGKDYPILMRESPIKLSYLLYDNWQPNSEHPRYGIYPILVGTFKTTLVALLIAAPLSILAALYTAFFAPKRLREIIKPTIEILAGFPSVVIGFFCLMTVATLVQDTFGTTFRLNAVVGGIGLALAVIPIIYTIADDALRSIPKSLREAALAVGASEWQAAYQVMLPAATPGIFAAILLGLGRAFGETMIALMATGNAGTFSWNFFEPVRTFAATIGAEMGEVVFGSPHYQLLFLLGIILFIFSFGINFVTEFYVKQRLIKKFRGVE